VTAPTWLLLPTYNEAENLSAMVAAILPELATGAPEGFRVLVIDDASPDGTGAIADELAASHAEVEVLHRPAKAGLGRAYVAGFGRALDAGAQRVLEMDADFSHDPADLPRLLAASDRGAPLVLGSRYVAGGGVEDWGALRRIVSRGGCLYARAILSAPVHDLTGGFKCFRREVLEAIDLPSITSEGYVFQIETTYRALRSGFSVEEVPIVFRDRRAGSSKMTARIALEAAWRVPRLRLRRS
jgi:dolichol-phosphate mannosyltransferase